MGWREILSHETVSQNSQNSQKGQKEAILRILRTFPSRRVFNNNNNNISRNYSQNSQNSNIDLTESQVIDNQETEIDSCPKQIEKHKVGSCKGCNRYSWAKEGNVMRPWCLQTDKPVFDLNECPQGNWFKCKLESFLPDKNIITDNNTNTSDNSGSCSTCKANFKNKCYAYALFDGKPGRPKSCEEATKDCKYVGGIGNDNNNGYRD